MAVLFTSNDEHVQAHYYHHQPLDLNSRMPQVLDNMAVIHNRLGSSTQEQGDADGTDLCFDLTADNLVKAIRMAPTNYIEAQSFLNNSDRVSLTVFFQAIKR
jgi:hypothetical protein